MLRSDATLAKHIFILQQDQVIFILVWEEVILFYLLSYTIYGLNLLSTFMIFKVLIFHTTGYKCHTTIQACPYIMHICITLCFIKIYNTYDQYILNIAK